MKKLQGLSKPWRRRNTGNAVPLPAKRAVPTGGAGRRSERAGGEDPSTEATTGSDSASAPPSARTDRLPPPPRPPPPAPASMRSARDAALLPSKDRGAAAPPSRRPPADWRSRSAPPKVRNGSRNGNGESKRKSKSNGSRRRSSGNANKREEERRRKSERARRSRSVPPAAVADRRGGREKKGSKASSGRESSKSVGHSVRRYVPDGQKGRPSRRSEEQGKREKADDGRRIGHKKPSALNDGRWRAQSTKRPTDEREVRRRRAHSVAEANSRRNRLGQEPRLDGGGGRQRKDGGLKQRHRPDAVRTSGGKGEDGHKKPHRDRHPQMGEVDQRRLSLVRRPRNRQRAWSEGPKARRRSPPRGLALADGRSRSRSPRRSRSAGPLRLTSGDREGRALLSSRRSVRGVRPLLLTDGRVGEDEHHLERRWSDGSTVHRRRRSRSQRKEDWRVEGEGSCRCQYRLRGCHDRASDRHDLCRSGSGDPPLRSKSPYERRRRPKSQGRARGEEDLRSFMSAAVSTSSVRGRHSGGGRPKRRDRRTLRDEDPLLRRSKSRQRRQSRHQDLDSEAPLPRRSLSQHRDRDRDNSRVPRSRRPIVEGPFPRRCLSRHRESGGDSRVPESRRLDAERRSLSGNRDRDRGGSRFPESRRSVISPLPRRSLSRHQDSSGDDSRSPENRRPADKGPLPGRSLSRHGDRDGDSSRVPESRRPLDKAPLHMRSLSWHSDDKRSPSGRRQSSRSAPRRTPGSPPPPIADEAKHWGQEMRPSHRTSTHSGSVKDRFRESKSEGADPAPRHQHQPIQATQTIATDRAPSPPRASAVDKTQVRRAMRCAKDRQQQPAGRERAASSRSLPGTGIQEDPNAGNRNRSFVAQQDPIVQSDALTRTEARSRGQPACMASPRAPQPSPPYGRHAPRSAGGGVRQRPPPPPPRKSNPNSAPLPAPPPSDANPTPVDEDFSIGPEPINSATARLRGLSKVVNLIFADNFGGGPGLYSGELDEWGRPHGRGKMRYDSGRQYEGGWSNGQPNLAEYRQQMNPPAPPSVPMVGHPHYASSASLAQSSLGFAPQQPVMPAMIYGGPPMNQMNFQGGAVMMGQGVMPQPHPMLNGVNRANGSVTMMGVNRMNAQVPMIGPGMPLPMTISAYASAAPEQQQMQPS